MLHTKVHKSPPVPEKKIFEGFLPGNKLEGDWGEIVALGAEISP